jgi:hypothetical protein
MLLNYNKKLKQEVKTRVSLQKRDQENEIMEELNFSSMGEIKTEAG